MFYREKLTSNVRMSSNIEPRQWSPKILAETVLPPFNSPLPPKSMLEIAETTKDIRVEPIQEVKVKVDKI